MKRHHIELVRFPLHALVVTSHEHVPFVSVLVVPEPLLLNLNLSVSGFTLSGMTVSGLSAIRLEYVKVNATDLTVS